MKDMWIILIILSITFALVAAIILGISMIPNPKDETPVCIECSCIEGYKFTKSGVQILDVFGTGIRCREDR